MNRSMHNAGQLLMLQIGLVGVVGGLAAGLLFASVASGSPLSIILFYLAPLPIMIAAIAWSHWSGLTAVALAATGLAVMFGAKFFVTFLLTVGAPAWWLGYLALLARPSARPGGLEWYSPGHLVWWTALLGALAVVASIPFFGFDQQTFEATLRAGFERLIRIELGTPANDPLVMRGISEPQRFIDLLVVIFPPVAAAITAFTYMLNLWLAARIVRVSGRLRRPWPDLAAMRFPGNAPAFFATVMAMAVGPALLSETARRHGEIAVAQALDLGLLGVICGVFATALLLAYGVLGLAVLHMLTRGRATRGIVLTAVYATLIIFGWPIVVMSLIGLADTVLDLRGRCAARRGPPAFP